MSIKKAVALFEIGNIKNDLAYVKSKFGIITQSVLKLENVIEKNWGLKSMFIMLDILNDNNLDEDFSNLTLWEGIHSVMYKLYCSDTFNVNGLYKAILKGF